MEKGAEAAPSEYAAVTSMPPTLADLHETLIRHNVDFMSGEVFGMPYSALKQVIYPTPPYRSFIITKRNGSPRVILEPRLRVKELQQKLLGFLVDKAGSPKPCVHGFTKGRSIVSNARFHCNRQTHHLLNVDLEDFFPSITFYRVRGVFQNKPFGFSFEVSTVLAHLCTYNGALPQGAPTSPFIANLICRTLDKELMALAKRHRARYTRYADDLTFSFSVRQAQHLPSNICSFEAGVVALGNELKELVKSHSFRINEAKSRVSTRLHRMEVTGIKINEFPNVRRSFIDQIRGGLHAWEKFGYSLANQEWGRKVKTGATIAYEKRPWKRQTRTKRPPELRNVLWGKLLYLKMVRGSSDALYTRLAEKFNLLCAAEAENGTFQHPKLPVEPIVRNGNDAEKAVYILEWSGDYRPSGSSHSDAVYAQGTAFAYRGVGLVTCDHVLRCGSQVSGVTTEVDFESGDIHDKELTVTCQATGKKSNVVILKRDAGRDLAFLQFDDHALPERYFVPVDAPIHRNAAGTLIGFPNWSPGRPANHSGCRVLSTYPRSGLQRFEISTNIRKGNSGGPYVDELFRVAGIAQQGAQQDDGNDECLCVHELDSWLESS